MLVMLRNGATMTTDSGSNGPRIQHELNNDLGHLFGLGWYSLIGIGAAVILAGWLS